MNGSEEHRPSDQEAEELEGLLLLLLGEGELPEATPPILRYLERQAARQRVREGEVRRIAEQVRARLITERLQAATVWPVRSLGTHLRAKRLKADCHAAQVAAALGQEEAAYSALESGRTSPLRVSAVVLARIVKVFGLSLPELRSALLWSLGGLGTAAGESFARSRRDRFDVDRKAVAAEDLRRAARTDKGSLDPATREQVDEKIREVDRILSAKGEEASS